MPKSAIDHIGSVYKYLKIDQEECLQESLKQNGLFIPFANAIVSDFNLMIIGSRPTNGRTLFTNELLISNTILNDRTCMQFGRQRKRTLAYFLTEKPANYFNKLITGILGVPRKRLMQMMTNPKQDIVSAEVHQLDFDFHLYPLFLEFNLPKGISEFVSKIESDIKECNPDYIFIDGLEILAQPEKRESEFNGTREIEGWLDACLEINKKHAIPFVVTRLLNPRNEALYDIFPTVLGDFNSSMIESACDIVISMARPSYYGMFDEQNNNKQDKTVQFIIHRDRSGTLTDKYQSEIDFEIPKLIFPKNNVNW